MLEKLIAESVEHGLHEWEAALHSPVKWEPVTIEPLSSVNGSIKLGADGAIRASSEAKGDAEFVIHLRLLRAGVTAFRFEWAAGEREEVIEIGEMEIRPETKAPVISVATATGNLEKPDGSIANAFDGNPATAWRVSIHGGKPAAAAFELSSPLKDAPPASMILTLRNLRSVQSPGSFRIYATTANPPVLEVPESIRATMALEPSERSEEQRREFETYYRTHSRDCAALERELARLKAATNPGIKVSPE